MPEQPAALYITHLTHDLVKQTSIVMVVWNDGSERRLGLTVPYGTLLDDIHREATAAVQRLIAELSTIPVSPVPPPPA